MTGDYYGKFKALWHELDSNTSLEACCTKKQSKHLEEQHIFKLLGGVNPKYENISACHDPLPPIGTVLPLLQGEGSRMLMKQHLIGQLLH